MEAEIEEYALTSEMTDARYEQIKQEQEQNRQNRLARSQNKATATRSAAQAEGSSLSAESIDQELAAETEGLTLKQRVARLEKKSIIEQAQGIPAERLQNLVESDEKWVSEMVNLAQGSSQCAVDQRNDVEDLARLLDHCGAAPNPEQPITDDDPETEAWIQDMLKRSGQVSK